MQFICTQLYKVFTFNFYISSAGNGWRYCVMFWLWMPHQAIHSPTGDIDPYEQSLSEERNIAETNEGWF